MLAAEKAQLQGTLAQDIIRIRERELQFYAESLSGIATVGALLAGIAFGMFSDMWNWNFFDLDDTGVSDTNAPLANIVHLAKLVGQWSAAQWLQNVFYFLQALFTVITLVTNLTLVQNCVVTNIAGVGLALRGPDGSVHRSLTHMRRELRRASRMLHRGLSSLATTIAVQLVGVFPFYIGWPLLITGLVLYRHSQLRYERLLVIFAMRKVDDKTMDKIAESRADVASESGMMSELNIAEADEHVPGPLARAYHRCGSIRVLSGPRACLLRWFDRLGELFYGHEEVMATGAEESSMYGDLLTRTKSPRHTVISFRSTVANNDASPPRDIDPNSALTRPRVKAADEADRLIQFHQERIIQLSEIKRQSQRSQRSRMSEEDSARVIQRAVRRQHGFLGSQTTLAGALHQALMGRPGQSRGTSRTDLCAVTAAPGGASSSDSSLNVPEHLRHVRFASQDQGTPSVRIDIPSESPESTDAAAAHASAGWRSTSANDSDGHDHTACNARAFTRPVERSVNVNVRPMLEQRAAAAEATLQQSLIRPLERCLESFVGRLHL